MTRVCCLITLAFVIKSSGLVIGTISTILVFTVFSWFCVCSTIHIQSCIHITICPKTVLIPISVSIYMVLSISICCHRQSLENVSHLFLHISLLRNFVLLPISIPTYLVLSIFAINNNLLKSSTFYTLHWNAIYIPPSLRKPNIRCGVLNHHADIGEYLMFRKADGSDIREDETDNDPLLAKELWKDFIHMTVATVCKFASMRDDTPFKVCWLGLQIPNYAKSHELTIEGPG